LHYEGQASRTNHAAVDCGMPLGGALGREEESRTSEAIILVGSIPCSMPAPSQLDTGDGGIAADEEKVAGLAPENCCGGKQEKGTAGDQFRSGSGRTWVLGVAYRIHRAMSQAVGTAFPGASYCQCWMRSQRKCGRRLHAPPNEGQCHAETSWQGTSATVVPARSE
jgi:hypothetical protein